LLDDLPEAPGLGLHVETIDWDSSERPPPRKVLFAPLTPATLNVAKFVRDQLDEWGEYADPEVQAEIVASLERERAYARGHEPATVRTVRADLSRARPAKWAWSQRVYIGGLNLMIGAEGVGKGTQAAWMLARLTRGELEGEWLGAPVNVAVIGTEDSFHDIWVPRLHVAGADLDRVVQFERPDGGVLGLQEDRLGIGRAFQENDIKVAYFDSLLDNLGAGTNAWYDKSVREALDPARWLGAELDMAIIGSLHPNKRGESFSNVVSGARAFNAVSRASLLLGKHPDDDHVRVVLRGKGNYSEEPQALEWDLASAEFEYEGRRFNMSKVEDMRPSTVTLDDLLEGFSPDAKTQRGPSKVQRAREHMERVLPIGERQPSGPIIKELEKMDIKGNKTLMTARAEAHVETFQAEGCWWWLRNAA
jgi:hypothetical protein